MSGVGPSKKLLLHGVIRDENLTNNGETFIIYFVAVIISLDGPKII